MKLDYGLNKKGGPPSQVKESLEKDSYDQHTNTTTAATDRNQTDNQMIVNSNVGMNWYIIAKMGNIQFLLSCVSE
ncbi:hypothetical protein KIN20_008680 [Parelaphostrongylus tenuis]|uniref:Uncharacterized protein n=1 Tax=Parelaphostrongylus tenuis TaxID=148309 RepID=A0AAD5MPD4_PARTN|nr:hypothetical protein KIN20_008680 [Parelaphostrongylus tenuis]